MGRALGIVVFVLLLSPRVARADCDKDWGFMSAESFLMFMNVQNLAINGDNTPRRLVGLAAPTGGQMLLGGGLSAQVRCDYALWDIISVRIAKGFGTTLGGTSSIDGGTASAGLGPLTLAEVGFPFFGIPNGFQVYPTYNWKVAFKVEWGVEYIGADATLTGATYQGASGSVDDWDFFFRSQLATCRRLSKVEGASTRWGCLTVSPMVYEKQWFSSIALGVRVDL